MSTPDAIETLRIARRDGVSLALLPDGRIGYAGPSFALRHHLPAIQRNLDGIANLLAADRQAITEGCAQ